MENFFKKSIKKLATGVAFVGALAGSPSKTEAQNLKEHKPIYTNDLNDPKLKVYKDSLDIYNLSKTVEKNRFNLSEVTKEEYDFYNKKNLEDHPLWYAFDQDQYNKDKKENKVKDFKDYIYTYPRFKNGNDYKRYENNLRLTNETYNRNYPEKDDTPNKEITLKNGVKRIWQTYKGQIIEKSDYTDYDPQTKTSKQYFDGKLDGIYNPKIKPINTKYFSEKIEKPAEEISLSSSSTGWYKAGEKKPQFKNTSKDKFINYDVSADQYNEYKKPVQPVIYTKDKNLLSKNNLKVVKALDESFENTFVKKENKIETLKTEIEQKISEKEIILPKGPIKYNTIDKAGNKYFFMTDSVGGTVRSVTEQAYKNDYKDLPEVKYEDLKRGQEGK